MKKVESRRVGRFHPLKLKPLIVKPVFFLKKQCLRKVKMLIFFALSTTAPGYVEANRYVYLLLYKKPTNEVVRNANNIILYMYKCVAIVCKKLIK